MLVTKFLTHVTKFVIRVTNFVTNFFCADSENYLGIRKKLLGISKKNPPRKLEADKRRGKGIALFSDGLLKGLGPQTFQSYLSNIQSNKCNNEGLKGFSG